MHLCEVSCSTQPATGQSVLQTLSQKEKLRYSAIWKLTLKPTLLTWVAVCDQCMAGGFGIPLFRLCFVGYYVSGGHMAADSNQGQREPYSFSHFKQLLKLFMYTHVQHMFPSFKCIICH